MAYSRKGSTAPEFTYAAGAAVFPSAATVPAMTVDDAVGLFGLGNMGIAIAGRLRRHFEVVAFDPDPARLEPARRLGVHLADDAAGVAQACRRAVLSLPRPAVSDEVVGTLLATWPDGGLVVETSTVTPADAR